MDSRLRKMKREFGEDGSPIFTTSEHQLWF